MALATALAQSPARISGSHVSCEDGARMVGASRAVLDLLNLTADIFPQPLSEP